METIEKRGTVKRTQQGALVAELGWSDVLDLIDRKNVVLKVGETVAAVIDTGARFKRGPYAYGYVYLADAEAAATVAPLAMQPSGPRLSAEDLEDMGEYDEALRLRETAAGGALVEDA